MNIRRLLLLCLVAPLVAATLIGCGSGGQQPPASAAPSPAETPAASATAIIEPCSGSDVAGTATFALQSDGQVNLTLDLTGLTPGEHAVHLHEFGDCSAEDGSSAGGHWNPTGEDHGAWGTHPFHLGDIGNVTADDDGTATFTLTTDLWTIGTGADDDVVGRAVIVHDGADDYQTQPTGAAGGRVACGVVVANEAH